VYAAEQVQPPEPTPTATSEPTQSATTAPSDEPTAGASETAQAPSDEPSAPASTEPSGTGNNKPLPALPTAPPVPLDKACVPADGQGTPPDKALEWQPTEACQTAFAEFTCETQVNDVADQGLFACNQEKNEKYLLGPTLIEGNQLATAVAGIPQNNVNWVVNLEFNSEGGAAFEQATREISQKSEPQNRFAIVLDGVSISAPSVNEAIPGGRAEISGNFTQKSATELANVLKYGALPLAFDVSEVSNVSATLGGEQLRAGIIAGIVGLMLVIGYCFWYYRGLGIVVVASLGIAAILTYACVVLLGSSVGFALNLPGIAGIIVAIGITADSFVIFFERIRDEVREGRSLRTAVETGWRRARQTILIADTVSLLSALVLFVLAIGSVKGFAFTLGLTTLIDVVVVFLFTKPLMTLLARTKFFGGGHRLSGLDPEHLGVQALPGSRSRRPVVPRPAVLSEERA
jgi:preprotein translocase subunit SecD